MFIRRLITASVVAIGALIVWPAHATEVKVRLSQSRVSASVVGIDLVLLGEGSELRFAATSSRVPKGPSGSASDLTARQAHQNTEKSTEKIPEKLTGEHAKKRAVGSAMTSLSISARRVGGRTLWTIADKSSGVVRGRLVGEAIEVRGDMLRVDLKPTPGNVTLRAVPGSAKMMDIITRMDLETYLLGVLPREMPANWPLEALKAQAVASRSFALERIRTRTRENLAYHLESTVMDQVFAWHEPDAIGGERLENVRRALNETKDEILSDSKGQVVAAYFHADCGGKTETANAVWGGSAKATGTAIDRSCPFSPRARWRWSVSSEELAMRLRSTLGLPLQSKIADMRAESLSESGRILKLALIMDDGTKRRLSGQQLRSVLGFDRVKSTAFEVKRRIDGGFSFEGRGHGHGVGLCQWGSKKLASQGADYKRILSHYYPKAAFARLAPKGERL